jgi:hypothetical protein
MSAVSACEEASAMIINCHCHPGKGDGLTGSWHTVVSLVRYLRRLTRPDVERMVVFPISHRGLHPAGIMRGWKKEDTMDNVYRALREFELSLGELQPEHFEFPPGVEESHQVTCVLSPADCRITECQQQHTNLLEECELSVKAKPIWKPAEYKTAAVGVI